MLPSFRALVLACLACFSCAATAATVRFSPAAQTVELGSIASVDIQVTDLSNQQVGAYDFFVDFDSTLLAVLSADFGPSLGHPFDNLTSVVLSSGRINVAEISLLPDLDGLQSGFGDMLLFTLRFETLATGTAALNFAPNILGFAGGYLGDAGGAPLAITAPAAGSITIVTATPPPPPPTPPTLPPASSPVSTPSSLALLAAAALAAAATRRRPLSAH